MDQDRAAASMERAKSAPSLSQTASNPNATTSCDPDELYISSLDYTSADLGIHPTLQTGATPIFQQSLQQPTADLDLLQSRRLQSPRAFEEAATAAMSHQVSQRTNKNSSQYQLISAESPADQARSLSQNNKDQLISSLRTHRVNTITELRRIEKIFAYLDSEEVTEPMTLAWAYYVNSNNLLNELRGLTKKIPFSSECLDEAKALVVADPASVRSWNYCWLVLIKMEKENLITKYARALAAKRSTWGDRQPTGDDARRFITACVAEWTQALRQLLKHWDKAPSTTGN